MANDLVLTSQGIGSNNYAILRDSSNNVWSVANGQFEVWANANLGDYDIVLTDRGGDLYTANFPNVAPGNYRVQFYRRAGAAPSLTDLILSAYDTYWTGSSTTPAPIAGISPYALIQDLDYIKLYLNINLDDNTKDLLLIQLVNAVSAKVEKVCSRKFILRDYKETVWCNYSNVVVVDNGPVKRITKLGYGQDIAFTIRNTVDVRAMVIVEDNYLALLVYGASSGTGTGSSCQEEFRFELSDYCTTSALVTAINNIAGFTAVLLKDVPTDELIEMSGRDCTKQTVNVQSVSETSMTMDYTIHRDIGAVSFGAIPARSAVVWYQAGWDVDDIPEDLKLLIVEIIAIQIGMVGENMTLVSTANEVRTLSTRALMELEDAQMKVLNAYKYYKIGDVV